MPGMTAAQLQTLATARRDWERAREMGQAILKTTSPVGNKVAAAKMEEFDQLINSIIAQLDAVHHVAFASTEESHATLHDLKREATTFVLAFLAIGLAIAVAGFLVLKRLLFPPLQDLSRGMQLFSEGQHSHRIARNMPVELRELAEGFNTMAENLQAQHAELVKASSHDALTGCLNHGQFIMDFDREFSRVNRYKDNLSLLMVDLDHFKSVNDTYGHPAGDVVLQKVAEAMDSQLRASDTLYRYGGEEFVILLPETDSRGALTVAESIRRKVADTAIVVDGQQTVTITVSIGVACFPQDTEKQEDLLKKADQAVYAAKNNGRNRVCHL
jgi:diguanylate cyclase (GGDEF)-like protein